MGSRCAVLIPSLRPHLWPEIRKNVKATGGAAYFLGDRYRSYSDAINQGWKRTSEPYVFLGADDLVFHEGWLDAALEVMRGDVRVVGTNDMHNPFVLAGKHSTHSLIDRRYVKQTGCVIDRDPGQILFPYRHQYTDSEMVETAIHRGVFAPCLDARVEHRHPDFGTRSPDEIDRRTRAHWREDFDLFMERRPLWHGDEFGPRYRAP